MENVANEFEKKCPPLFLHRSDLLISKSSARKITKTHTQNVSIYYAVKYALSRVESEGEKEQGKMKAAAAAILRRLDSVDNDEEAQSEDRRNRRPRKEDIVLNQWEQAVAMDIVAPEDIPVTFEGGVMESRVHDFQTLIAFFS